MSIQLIAREAGVSTATVSRVINRHPLVSSLSRRKVEEAMVKTGYVPPDPARRRGPRTQAHRGIRTRSIAVLFSGLERPLVYSPLHATLLHGIEQAINQKNMNLILSQFSSSSELPPAVKSGSVDGVLIEGQLPSGEAADRLRRFPCVWLLTQRGSGWWGDYVEPDNRQVGETAAKYLLDRGHTHLAFLNLEPNLPAFARRAEAFEHAAREAGATVDLLVEGTVHSAPVFMTYPEEQQVEAVVDRMLALKPRPTGLFIPFDLLTAVVQRVLASRGVKPGKDLTIVSCNNEWQGLAGLSPRPATIDLNVELIGRRAVAQLLWRMANPDEPAGMRILVPPTLRTPETDPAGGNGSNGLKAAERQPVVTRKSGAAAGKTQATQKAR